MTLILHKLAHFFYGHGLGFIARLVWLLNRMMNGADISPKAVLGRIFIFHPVGIVIGGDVSIGDGSILMSGVLVGGGGFWRNGMHIPSKSCSGDGEGHPVIGKVCLLARML